MPDLSTILHLHIYVITDIFGADMFFQLLLLAEEYEELRTVAKLYFLWLLQRERLTPEQQERAKAYFRRWGL